MAIASINPATGETIKTFEPLPAQEVEQRIAKAHAAFEAYRLIDFKTRSQWLQKAAQILEDEPWQGGPTGQRL